MSLRRNGTDRRQFLRWAGSLGLGLAGSRFLTACSQEPRVDAGGSFLVPEWTGDSFAPMHRIAEGEQLLAPRPSGTVDVVIIGGGLSGLTAAWRLRNENLLLLEREREVGGNAKQGEFQGIPYALGSAYLVDTDEPYGPLYAELGLELKPVPEPADMAMLSGKWAPLESGEVGPAFLKLKKHLAAFLEKDDSPSIPLASASPKALKLDRISFYDYLKTDYPPELLACIDAYCYSALGGGIREISAYAGINFYSEIAGPIYAFPGGNAAVARRLAQKVDEAGGGRMKTGVSVYRIEQQGDRVLTSFFPNESPDAVETVASRAVILATPYFCAARILHDMPHGQRDFIKSMTYGSYLVANCCFDRRVFKGGYDHWAPHNTAMTDFIVADYVTGGNAKPDNAPSVLSVYAPFRDAKAGRALLHAGDRQAAARLIEKGLREVVGFPPGSLKEVRLTRYGHQLLTSHIGLMQQLAGMEKAVGRVLLAHSDGQGMAAIESAVMEGLGAAERAKALMRRA